LDAQEKSIPTSLKKFSENIKVLRLNNEKSIYQVAKEMDINYSFLREIEAMEKQPSFATIDKIAEYYKVAIYELFI